MAREGATSWGMYEKWCFFWRTVVSTELKEVMVNIIPILDYSNPHGLAPRIRDKIG